CALRFRPLGRGGATRRRTSMKKQRLGTAVWLSGLLALASVGTVQGQDVASRATDPGLSIPDCVVYCLTNWRTLPEQMSVVGRQVWEQNAPALLVLIGGHGIGKTSSNGIPGSPGTGVGKI